MIIFYYLGTFCIFHIIVFFAKQKAPFKKYFPTTSAKRSNPYRRIPYTNCISYYVIFFIFFIDFIIFPFIILTCAG